MRKLLLIFLLVAQSGFSATTNYVGLVNVELLPGNNSIGRLVEYYEELSNGESDSVLVTNYANNANVVFENGLSYSFPFSCEIDYNEKIGHIEKYSIEYIPLILDPADPSFTLSNPSFDTSLKIIIEHDLIKDIHKKKRIDMNEEVVDETILEGDIKGFEDPELIFMYYVIHKKLKQQEPVSVFENDDINIKEYVYNNAQVKVFDSISSFYSEMQIGSNKINTVRLTKNIESGIPLYMEMINKDKKITITLEK